MILSMLAEDEDSCFLLSSFNRQPEEVVTRQAEKELYLSKLN